MYVDKMADIPISILVLEGCSIINLIRLTRLTVFVQMMTSFKSEHAIQPGHPEFPGFITAQ